MAKREHFLAELQDGECYHIYNGSVNNESIFENPFYCRLFLNNLKKYALPYFDIYAWCVMHNHFHLLVRVNVGKAKAHGDPTKIASHALRKLFQKFAQHYNLFHKRKGAVFQTPFKRAHVDSPEYFTQMVYYIHNNPRHHQVKVDFENYEWSSYSTFLSHHATQIDRDSVLEWFGGIEGFIKYHLERREFEMLQIYIED